MNPFVLIIVSIVLAITGLAIDAQPQKPSAYTICMAAHGEVSGESEQACADALDSEGSVFLCDKSGLNCWTERI